MSQLTLIRHGQAAAFSDDTDRLTDLGEHQAALLGQHFVEQGMTFDDVVVGGMRRHAQTHAQVAAAFERAGLPWPKPSFDPGWNEYDGPEIMKQLRAALLERNPDMQRMLDDFAAVAGTDHPDRNRYFQRIFEAVMSAWIAGDPPVPGLETFAAFHGRVSAALQKVLATTGSRRVAVFTSGGPIGVCVQTVLQAPKSQAIDINWRLRNASLTEFQFGKGRVSLDTFNITTHFREDKHRTYR